MGWGLIASQCAVPFQGGFEVALTRICQAAALGLIGRFLCALLRVPVEKLKKREIESLMQRLVFLEDLLGR
ncbi:hypothetical protein DFAR_1990002 [Desulfarculales bacterium]